MIVLLFGLPGQSKSTQAIRIQKEYDIPFLDLYREIRNIKRTKKYLEQGYDHHKTSSCVLSDILDEYKTGFVVEMYPKEVDGYDMFRDVLKEKDLKCIQIYMKIDESLSISRQTSRIRCPNCNHTYNNMDMKPKVDDVCDYCNLPLYKDCETQEHAREKINLQNKIFNKVIEKVKSEFPYYTTDQSLTYEDISQNIDKIIEEQYGII